MVSTVATMPQTARPARRADASLSARLSLLFESAWRSRSATTSSAPRRGRACSARLPVSASCRCISRVASLARGATLSRSPPRRARPGSTPISSPRASASPRGPCAISGRRGSITCRSRSRICDAVSADRIAGYKGAFQRKHALATEAVRLGLMLTINLGRPPRQHRAGRGDGRSGAGAEKRAGSKSRMCSTTAGLCRTAPC